MPKPSRLDDPEYAAFAWARYRRLMRFMATITIGVVVVALCALYLSHGMISIHLYIAVAIGISAAMLLMALLMGLVFLSSGTGHDEAIEDPLEDDSRLDD